MGRNTSILLGDCFDQYVKNQISSGKYNSVSGVIKAALRVLEQEENKVKSIVHELEKGENSKEIKNFDKDNHLQELHAKYMER